MTHVSVPLIAMNNGEYALNENSDVFMFRLREFMGVDDSGDGVYRDLLLDAPHLPSFKRELLDVIEGKFIIYIRIMFENILNHLCIHALLVVSQIIAALRRTARAVQSSSVHTPHRYMYMYICA